MALIGNRENAHLLKRKRFKSPHFHEPQTLRKLETASRMLCDAKYLCVSCNKSKGENVAASLKLHAKGVGPGPQEQRQASKPMFIVA